MFDIRFVAPAAPDADGVPHAAGELLLGDYLVPFGADCSRWSPDDYVRHWRAGVQRLVNGGDRSALVTSWAGRGPGPHVIWPMWREGHHVFVQSPVALTDEDAEHFDPLDPGPAVGPRHVLPDDPARPGGEWVLRLENLLAFLLTTAR